MPGLTPSHAALTRLKGNEVIAKYGGTTEMGTTPGWKHLGLRFLTSMVARVARVAQGMWVGGGEGARHSRFCSPVRTVQEKASIRKPRNPLTIFLYRSPGSSSTVGGIALQRSSPPNSIHVKKTPPTHCQSTMCLEFLLQMGARNLNHPFILSILVLYSRTYI